jgi:membrane associated rhomboid family serine protease
MAFLRSGPEREPLLRVPAAVIGLIAVLVAAHMARILASPDFSERILVNYAFIPARYLPDAVDPGSIFARVAPFFTHQFLHADFTHLGINCLWLLAFGPVVARRFGALLFLVFFLVCGAAGAVAYLAFNWGSPAPMIGASGAISGLMAAAIRMLRLPLPAGAVQKERLAPIFSRQILVFIVLWMGVNLLFGLTGIGGVGGEVRLIAWQAHVGGFLAGLLLAGIFDAAASEPATATPQA